MASAESSQKKLVKFKSGLKMVPVNDSCHSPFYLKEPTWVPDEQCDFCINCRGKFDFFQRRHHCRRCGKCFCAKCCTSKYHLQRMCFVDPVLHCAVCATISQKETEFFQSQMKVLQQGHAFMLSGSMFSDDASGAYNCRISADQRHLVLEPSEAGNPFYSTQPIELQRIETARVLSSEKDTPGGKVVTGLSIFYSDPDEERHELRMMMLDYSSKQASEWQMTFHRALKMIFEGRQ